FIEKTCILDIQKNSVFACILDKQGKKFRKRLEPFTPNLIALCEALVEENCGNVAMKSTSIY
ncbi:MAG TPA: hypothetical protein PLE52_06585, partial [Paludibacteraceae bacterium]|nr:hypothetical protein [Paludibacteraceae bacterium]